MLRTGRNMRILVVEDEHRLREGLVDLLSAADHDVTAVGDGRAALETGIASTFDLVLLDLMLPQMDGIEVCRRLRQSRPTLPILMLTARGSEEEKVAGFAAGADDYVTKPFGVRELLARIDVFARRASSAPAEPEILELDGCTMDLGRHLATRGDETTHLTAREVGILRWLHRQQSRAVPRPELLERVWGTSGDLQTRTVDMTIAKLRQKIERDPTDPKIVVTVTGAGYAWGEDEQEGYVTSSRRRTTLAALALAVAVVLPTTAWYLTGASEAGRHARMLEDAVLTGLQRELHRDSDRLGTRLERLRTLESVRPFFQYQSITHDPRGAAEGLAVAPSPLAQGVSDPLVWTHFQLNENGLVTLPMVNERFPELSSIEDFTRFCSLLADLQNTMTLGLNNPAGSDNGYFEGELVSLSRSEWEQIRDADQFYAAFTGRGETPQKPRRGDLSDVVIRVGPLKWHTMVFDSGPTLAALREVETPLGIRLQGFAIAQTGVEQWLGADTDANVAFAPVVMLPADRLSSPVSDTGWWLSADATPLLEKARAEGRRGITEFRRIFALGAIAVLFSALAVVVVFYQTDRIARQRGRFAAAAAHELKTPLASLRLYSEMLSEGLGRPEQSRVYAARVASESGRLGRVVSNMLDLARLERGAQIANPQPGDLGAAVASCIERLETSLGDAGLTITTDIAEDLPTASFDVDALCQILDNLLDNAEKYTRGRPDRRAEVAVKNAADGIEITVSDNGPGISQIRAAIALQGVPTTR